MLETIYTIPINESFEACADDEKGGCPFCLLHRKLEENEIDLILGASMMEPDVRIKTNKLGFCRNHFGLMLKCKNRLGLGLILESHLGEIRSNISEKGLAALMGKGSSASRRIEELEKSCYICSRIESSFEKMFENTVWLWEQDGDFRRRFDSQPYFCLRHFRRLADTGKRELSKKKFPDFYDAAYSVTGKYLGKLCGDVSWFCKKFDYRYDNEPWGDSKDAIERAIKFLE